MIDALSMLSRFGCRFGMLLVLCCAAPAQAAWTFMGLQDGVGFFVDAENAESVNGYRRVWVQQNYPSPNVYRAQSMMLLIEIDCKDDKIRLLKLVAYSGQSQTGDSQTLRNGVGAWETTKPGSMFKSIQFAGCRQPMKRGYKLYTSKF
jgi:hypothetical protein